MGRSTFGLELHAHQYANITGRSCDSALHSLVCKIEEDLDDKEIDLVTFLDIEGTFDNIHTSVIGKTLLESMALMTRSWVDL